MVVMVVVIVSAVAVTRARVRLGSGVQWWNDKGGCLGSGRTVNQEGRGFDLRAEDFRTTLSILELPPFPNHRTFLLCVPFTTQSVWEQLFVRPRLTRPNFRHPHLATVRPRHGCAADGEVFFLNPSLPSIPLDHLQLHH